MMEDASLYTAIGLMSGTSLDGIDAALIRTDGRSCVETAEWLTEAYDEPLRAELRRALTRDEGLTETERRLTNAHAALVKRLLKQAGLSAGQVDVVGFHGQTIRHDPARKLTHQLGDGARLARELGIDVVNDFRSRDVAAGGEGAPFAPLYHAALAAPLARPLAVLNLGGVANVTWIGPGEAPALLAFDTGPANALIDDWVLARTGKRYDEGGVLARQGQVDAARLAALMDQPYFRVPPPKSLDRNDFSAASLEGLSLEDGAATLTAFTVQAVKQAVPHLPAPPLRWLLTGGGRHNPVLVDGLRRALGATIEPVEAVGWQGDALEAQAFAYLAVRSLKGLALSVPGTTRVPEPMTGGRHHRVRAAER